MKNGSFNIRIDNPCSEDWNAMTEAERGRFCNSCQKAVTDFTSFTDKEIFNYIQHRQGEKLCGRFSQQQLSRDLYPEFKQRSYSSMLKVAASIFLGALSSLPAHSQEQDSAGVENSISQSPMASRQIRIKGQVTSSDSSDIVSGATISIPGLDSTTSDSSGYFELDIMTPLDSIELLISAKGWESKQSVLQLSQLLLGHCSVLEKDLSLEPKTPEFQWENFKAVGEQLSAQPVDLIHMENITAIFGNFVTTGTPINYHTYPSEPNAAIAYTPLSQRVLNAFQPNCRPSAPPEPEYSVKKTRVTWGNPNEGPSEPTPSNSRPLNKEAVFLDSENEEKTKESK